MFRLSFLIVLTIIPAAFNQFITFKDGKFGVNFAGYHAEAGLGGLLTGDAAHGGLSASAGTPFGQKAGAGIGGTVNDGNSRGGAFAGASAGYGVGASAALGGNVGGEGGTGGIGSEAHAGGYSSKTVKLSQTPQPQNPQQASTFVKDVGVYKSVASIDQRSSFGGDAPETPPITQQLPLAPAGKRFYKRKHLRRGGKDRIKTVQIERRYSAPQNYATYSQPQPSNLDYRKFFDFGFFSNAGATFSGAPHPSAQNGQVLSYQKQLSPSTVVLHKSVNPSVATYQEVPETRIDQRFKDDSISSEEGVEEEEVKTKVKENRRSGSTTYTATKQFQPNPNFFNDIFNIPISTLGAVSQFLSNGVGNGVAVTKTKTVETGNY